MNDILSSWKEQAKLKSKELTYGNKDKYYKDEIYNNLIIRVGVIYEKNICWCRE